MFNLSSENNDPKLRTLLQETTDQYVGDSIGTQLIKISALNEDHRHSIALVAEARPSDRSTFQYNCYMHAFELQPPPDSVTRIASTFKRVFPNGNFARFLIANHLMEVAGEDVSDDDVVIYSSRGELRHAGKATNGFVISKWGTGHLWRHRVFEIPSSYGIEVRFFERLPRERAIAHFVQYAEARLGKARVAQLLQVRA